MDGWNVVEGSTGFHPLRMTMETIKKSSHLAGTNQKIENYLKVESLFKKSPNILGCIVFPKWGYDFAPPRKGDTK